MNKTLRMFSLVFLAFASTAHASLMSNDEIEQDVGYGWAASEIQIESAKCRPDLSFIKTRSDALSYIESKRYKLAQNIKSYFRQDELMDIASAISMMPDLLINHYEHDNFKIISFTPSLGQGVIANATIQLTQSWRELPKAFREYAFFHELAHNVDIYEMSHDPNSAWIKDISLWKNLNYFRHNVVSAGIPLDISSHISKYSRTSPSEDWAESISAYRYVPERLRKTSPARYEFIKKLFVGTEFVDDENCHDSSESSAIISPFFKDLVRDTDRNFRALIDQIYFEFKFSPHSSTCLNAEPLYFNQLNLCIYKEAVWHEAKRRLEFSKESKLDRMLDLFRAKALIYSNNDGYDKLSERRKSFLDKKIIKLIEKAKSQQ